MDRIAPEDHLRRVMSDWVVDVNHSHNLVVLRTPPGSAHVVASALDRAGIADILGTVAGDDTLVAVAAESITGVGSQNGCGHSPGYLKFLTFEIPDSQREASQP